MQGEEGEGDGKIATDGDTLDEDVCVIQLLQVVGLKSSLGSVDQCCNIDRQHEKALRFLELGQRTSQAGEMFVSGLGSDSLGHLFGLAVSPWHQKSPETNVKDAPVPPDHQSETEKSNSRLDPIGYVHLFQI